MQLAGEKGGTIVMVKAERHEAPDHGRVQPGASTSMAVPAYCAFKTLKRLWDITMSPTQAGAIIRIALKGSGLMS